MTPRQCPEFFGQGEGQQEILGRHLLFELTLQPSLAFVVLTMRAVTMPAGVRHEHPAVAVGTLRQHPRTEQRAAALHGRQRLEVGRQDRALELVQERGFKGLKER